MEGGEEGSGREQCIGSERSGNASCIWRRGGIDSDFESDAKDVPLAAVFGEGIGCGGQGRCDKGESRG